MTGDTRGALGTAQAMAIALHEGRKGTGFVAPNPLVGCAILDGNRNLLATGYHHKVGHDHAEIDALKKLKPEQVAGSHVYVTLEPCAHQGRTGSCAKALAQLKPASVTYAVEDPNPLVAGQGARILREAGVDTDLLANRKDLTPEEASELEEQAEDLAEIFLHNMRAKEPFIAMKVASSLDGKMAYASGESKWITGEAAREHVHTLRARYDAVAVGRATFVADDPSLNVRHASYPNFTNKAILFDPEGLTLKAIGTSNLLKVRSPENVFVVTDAKRTLENPAGVKVLKVPMAGTEEFMMDELLQQFREHAITSVMLEGGARTYGAFFNAKKVQRLHVYLAPMLLGSRSGLSWSQGFGGESMKERIDLKRVERQTIGADDYWTARL
jgi:diaminohydroxyphosphoribosylaminopyrimidine deaminase/5-amino-6-(5-phosphoribosylamino)uracil reductase